MENSIEVAQKIKIACDPAIQLQGMYSKGVKLAYKKWSLRLYALQHYS